MAKVRKRDTEAEAGRGVAPAVRGLEDVTTILESITDAFFALDREWRFTYLNGEAERLLRRGRGELLGRSVWEAFPEAVGSDFYTEYHRAVQDGRTARFEAYYQPLETRFSVTAYPAERGLAVYFRDVTEEHRLEEAERRLLEILEATPDIVAIRDVDGRVLYVNRAGRRTAAGPDVEGLEVEALRLVHPDWAAELLLNEAIPTAIRDGLWTGETAFLDADGREIAASQIVLGHRNEAGDVAFTSTIMRDITDIKVRQRALRESEERYRQLFELAPVGIVHVTPDGRYVDSNAAYQEMLGYTGEELSALRWQDLTYPADLEANQSLFDELHSGARDTYAHEKRYLHRDGHVVWARVSVAAVRDSDGVVELVIGMAEDVTDRKVAEAGLERRDAVLEAVSYAGARFLQADDWESCISDVLRRFGEATDMSRVYVMRRWVTEDGAEHASLMHEWVAAGVVPAIVDPDMKDFLPAEVGLGRWMDLFRAGSVLHGVVSELPAFERPLLEAQQILSIAAVPVMVGEELWGMLGWDDCVAERRWTGSELEALRAAAGALAAAIQRREMEKALARSEEQLRQSQKMEAVGRLAGGVAHDFNNMLTAIQGFSTLLQNEVTPESRGQEYLEEVIRAADRSAALTRQLLAFSRKQVLRPKVVDLNATIGELERMLRRLLGEDIHLQTVLEDELHRVKVDPGQVEQVLLNLAVNARDAMPGGGRLTIETRNMAVGGAGLPMAGGVLSPGSYVQIEVTDTGNGMAEETRERIFEPFFTTKPTGTGTGLGLATVFGIVNQSGGGIAVDSEPGTGTTFRILLPRHDGRPSQDVGRPVEGPPPGGVETVMVVEDEDAVRVLARRALEGAGYTVVSAATGTEAVDRAREWQGPIHVVLTDVVMPEMNGRELAERLRAERPDVRVCYMSGYTEDHVFRNGLEQRDTAFLEKPFHPATLLARVRTLIEQS